MEFLTKEMCNTKLTEFLIAKESFIYKINSINFSSEAIKKDIEMVTKMRSNIITMYSPIFSTQDKGSQRIILEYMRQITNRLNYLNNFLSENIKRTNIFIDKIKEIDFYISTLQDFI